jgi:hypothetical protein
LTAECIYATVYQYIQYDETSMAKRKKSAKKSSKVSEKVAKSYRLSPRRIAAAQRILGTPNATATIEEALDLVVFREELNEGLRRAHGMDIATVFPDGSEPA